LSLFNNLTKSCLSSFVKAPSAAYWALFSAQNLWINLQKQDTVISGQFKRSDNIRAYGIKTDTDFRALVFNVSFVPETLACSLNVNSYGQADVYSWGQTQFSWNGSSGVAAAFPNCGPVSYSTNAASLQSIVVAPQSLCIVRYHNADSTNAPPTILHVEAQDPNANPKRTFVVCGSVNGETSIIRGIDYAFDGDTTFKNSVKSLDSAYDGPFESFFDSISTVGLETGPHVFHFRARTGSSNFAYDSVAFILNNVLGVKTLSNKRIAISERRSMNRIELTFPRALFNQGKINAQVFALNGRCVRTLASIDNGGSSIIRWAGEDAAGNKVSGGVYMIVVKSTEKIVYKKPIVISR
jgi:hypothetical protein